MGYIACFSNFEHEVTPMLFANGAQRVTLPVYADENIKIVTKIYPIGNVGDTNIIGDEFDTDGWVLHFSGRDTLSFRYSRSNPLAVNSNPFTIREIEMATQDGSFKIDGTVVTSGNTTSYNHYPIQLFGINQGGNNASYVGIGEIKVYKDNTLYMHLLPQKDYTNKGYFYDVINDTNYYSETSNDLFYVEDLN